MPEKTIPYKRVRNLRTGSNLYQGIITRSSLAILIEDRDGKFIFFNDKFAGLFGYSNSEMKQNSIQDLIHIDDMIRITGFHKNRMLNLKAPSSYEFRGITKDRKLIFLEVDASPFEENGKCIGTLSYLKDITNRKLSELKNIQTNNIETVGRLAGGIAHEFNNILNIISGYSQVLLNQTPKTNPKYKKIQQISSAGKRAEMLTRQLLAFSSSLNFKPRIFDLNSFIDRKLNKITKILGEDIQLNTQLSKKELNVYTDPHKMEEVIINLVKNASDAMPKGGELKIKTQSVNRKYNQNMEYRLLEKGKYIKMTVQDSGCGMNRETMSKIFEPFYTTKEEGKGIGLGLSAVYGIIKQSQGEIDIQSKPGKGTNISIYLNENLQKN